MEATSASINRKIEMWFTWKTEYSVVKKNKIKNYARKGLDLVCRILSKVAQTQKKIECADPRSIMHKCEYVDSCKCFYRISFIKGIKKEEWWQMRRHRTQAKGHLRHERG